MLCAMRARNLHRWDVTPREARAIQQGLRAQVELGDRLPRRITRVAGADVAFDKARGVAIAGVVALRWPSLDVLERASAVCPLEFPYVPGLLSFREIPGLLAAFAKLKRSPQAVFCDAHGYAHPRRFGLACHLGLLLDVPTIGCAKSRLLGTHSQPGRARGDWTELHDAGETIGAVLRTRDDVNPIYVSQGHRVSLASAIALTLAAADGVRIPAPTRCADAYVREVKAER